MLIGVSFMAIMGIAGVLILMGTPLFVVPLWRICSRAGFSGAMSLWALIPAVGWVIPCFYLAFTKWPAEDDI